MTLFETSLLVAGGALAGVVNTLAGGGSLLAFVVMALVFAHAAGPVTTNDLYWHVSTGQLLWETGGFPQAELGGRLQQAEAVEDDEKRRAHVGGDGHPQGGDTRHGHEYECRF